MLLAAGAAAAASAFAHGVGPARDGPSASSPSAVAAAPFHGTAYLKTSNTVLYADKPYGLARAAVQGLVDQCNGFRTRYGVPPASPPESALAAIDVTIHEKYFDTDKALTLITGHTMRLPDMQRWLDELRALAPSGHPPDTPPDCAQTTTFELRSGTLWRDGLVYDLRYADAKAIARRASPAPVLQGSATAFLNAPQSTQLGQRCRELVGGVDLPGEGRTCIWDLFPYVSYLNWPFALSGRYQFGPTATMFESVVPIEAEHGQSIPSSVFDIPSGFTVVGP